MRTAVLISIVSLFSLGCSGGKGDSDAQANSAAPPSYPAAELKAVVEPQRQSVPIGAWEDTRPFMMLRFEIVDLGQEKFALVGKGLKPGDSSRNITDLREVPNATGRRFDRVDARHGDHYILLPTGSIEVRDREGLISTHNNLLAN